MRTKIRRVGPASRALLALTRHGALAVASRLHAERAITPTRRALALLAGSILIGIGVASFSRANFGLPPYDMMLSAISLHAGLTLGQSAWVAAGVLYIISTSLGRPPSLATLAFTFVNGLTVDATLSLTSAPTAVPVRLVLVAVGLTSIAAGIAFVVHSYSTGGPFELLMSAAEDRGMNPALFRTLLELTVFTGGAIAGGAFGWATILFAVAIGPVLRALLQGLTDYRAGRAIRLQNRGNATVLTS